jgi:NADH-quinone oxidoreductase subunit L
MHHEQDMRKMGGLKRWMPYTYWTFLISTLAIAGIPITSGFFSKDEILWKTFSSGHHALWVLAAAAALLTAFYMFRQVFMTFHGECRADHHTQEHLHESPLVMTVPLMILAGLALVAGFLNVPHALWGESRFEQWLAPVIVSGHGAVHGAAHGHGNVWTEYALMILSVGIAVAGILLAWAMYLGKSLSPEMFSNLAGGKLYTLVYNKYFVDEFYEKTVINGTLALTQASAWFDRTIIDGIVNLTARVTTLFSSLNGLFDHYVVDGAVNGVAAVAAFFGSRVRRLQTGGINAYLYVIVIAVVGVMVVQLL